MPETTATDKKQKPAKILASDPYTRTWDEQWKQNRGSQLLGFAILIFVVGCIYSLYRQHRFIPVQFPDGDSIETTNPEPAASTVIPKEAITIVVVGAQHDGGIMRVAFYDSAEGFNEPEMAAKRTSLSIDNGETSAWIPVDALPKRIAVAAFHDENGNGRLDRNRLGIPTERYGFSRDARGVTGPPDFEDAVIDRPESGQSISLSIR
jgi:uncharacterized protein (DUF2141 family)